MCGKVSIIVLILPSSFDNVLDIEPINFPGDVVLKDLELKAEALNELKLPVTVKAGFLGSVRLKVSSFPCQMQSMLGQSSHFCV